MMKRVFLVSVLLMTTCNVVMVCSPESEEDGAFRRRARMCAEEKYKVKRRFQRANQCEPTVGCGALWGVFLAVGYSYASYLAIQYTICRLEGVGSGAGAGAGPG